MRKIVSIIFGISVLAFSTVAMALDTGYDTMIELKAFTSSGGYFNLVLDSETNSCGGSTNSNFNIPLTDTELIRLAEAAWLSGKVVRLEYSCATIAGGTNARVTGVRAKDP